jgi:hypothetical protein
MADTVAWVRANVQPGEHIALGQFLSMALAIQLPESVQPTLIRTSLAIGDPSAPLGLDPGMGIPDDDLVTIEAAVGKANQFDVFSADRIRRQLQGAQVDYWVYPVSRRLTPQQILLALTPDNGFDEVYQRSYKTPSDIIDVHIYRVRRDSLRIGPDIHISETGLERLVNVLERSPARSATAAGLLVDRIARPADGSEDALIARLEALARH